MAHRFDQYVGIDYSGAQTPGAALPGLQAFVAEPEREPRSVPPTDGRRHWSRRGLAEWLRTEILSGRRLLVGIDHGFSFPLSYFRRTGLDAWPQFLEDFRRHWPTDREDCSVDAVRSGRIWQELPRPDGERGGGSGEFRLCERWTSSAKSVFQFDMQGSVAKSTHAGLPWLRWLRGECRGNLAVWPFDGWRLPGAGSVIAEVYPSLFRNRYPRAGRSVDAQDAYAVARWLQEAEGRGALDRYLDPPLTVGERAIADLEGWILGVT